jgi:hypothetical protein
MRFNGCTGLVRQRGTVRAGKFIYIYEKCHENHQFGTGFFYTPEYYQQLTL